MDNYSRDLTILQEKYGVKVYKTPKTVYESQLDAWDKVTAKLSKDPFFKKVVDSQKAWSKRVAYYELYNSADYQHAYEHSFGQLGFYSREPATNCFPGTGRREPTPPLTVPPTHPNPQHP